MSISRFIGTSSLSGNDTSNLTRDAVGSEQTTLFLSLRIIYTLNSSPQPLLARVKRKLPAIRISKDERDEQTGAKPSFGKVLLKSCLAAVCASSPELLGNSSRDFSIYVVDPLEDITGLSVGVGLLSWWLKNDHSPCNGDIDSDYAVGKVVVDRGTESLEVVMSLKETNPQSVEDYVKSLSLLRLPSPDPEQTVNADISISDKKHPGKDANKAKIGRPSGATTNPEKKARRVALLEQKETLKRLQNLAKMQRGEPYDSTLIVPNDVNAPKVTEEDIKCQQKIISDLESRPITSRQTTSLLTNKPLPNRTIIPPALNRRSSESMQREFGLTSSDNWSSASIARKASSIQAFTSSASDIGILQSVLTSMLGRIDSASTEPTVKGKETESTTHLEPTIVAFLGQLLPLLLARHGLSTNGQNHTPQLMFQPHSHQSWNYNTPVSSLLSSQGLFQTADETFRISNSTSPQLTRKLPINLDNDYTRAKSDPHNIKEDAYPVPGGGWARGRNLVPRTTTISNQQLTTKPESILEANSGKENEPPSNINQGVKRSAASLLDRETTCKHKSKKRKAEKSSHSDKVTGMRKTNSVSEGLAPKDENISHAASSPLVRTLSEPNFQGPSAPLIATSGFPFSESPRTPKTDTINLVEKSLSAPATPANITTHANGVCTETSLFTPSPVLVKSRESIERSILHPASIDSERFTMKLGWDLPPSSPPPPSPISSPAHLTVNDTLTTFNQESAQAMEEFELEQSFSSPLLIPSSVSARSSEFEELSEISEFSQPTFTCGIGLDIDELWSSLGPIIAQAHGESTGLTESDSSAFHATTDSQNGIDAAKLAEDLKALFGGCVV